MSNDKKFLVTPRPDPRRFWLGRLSISDERDYSEALLQLRARIRTHREHAGFDVQLLTGQSAFFDNDEAALLQSNPNSWFFSPSYRPHSQLSFDDFTIQVSSQHIHLPELYHLRNYLLASLATFNTNTCVAHLNHPLNFFYLDLADIFLKLASSHDPNYIKSALSNTEQYIKWVAAETQLIAPIDRGFMTHLRLKKILIDVLPRVNKKIEEQHVYDSLQTVSTQLRYFIEANHITLMNSFNTKKLPPTVNIDERLTLLFDCLKQLENPSFDIPQTQLAMASPKPELIRHCINVEFIPHTTKQDKLDYIQSMYQLYLLHQYRKGLDTLSEALLVHGETKMLEHYHSSIHQLLSTINEALLETHTLLKNIINRNENIYLQLLVDESQHNLLKQLANYVTGKRARIDGYFFNQEKLSKQHQSVRDKALEALAISSNLEQLSAKIQQLGTLPVLGDTNLLPADDSFTLTHPAIEFNSQLALGVVCSRMGKNLITWLLGSPPSPHTKNDDSKAKKLKQLCSQFRLKTKGQLDRRMHLDLAQIEGCIAQLSIAPSAADGGGEEEETAILLCQEKLNALVVRVTNKASLGQAAHWSQFFSHSGLDTVTTTRHTPVHQLS